MIIPVKSAKLIKRYKRFLADVVLHDNIETTIHCANTGAMKGCGQSNDTIWYSISTNPKRKYPFSWEVTQDKNNHFICVNTMRANQLVEEALREGTIKELKHFEQLKREVAFGSENSRVDFCISSANFPDTYIEVKSVTFLENDQGYFPDAVTTRGQKHLRELIEMVNQGHRAVLLFAVLHSGINNITVAKHIDANYAKLIKQAYKAGVEILAYKAEFTSKPNTISIQLTEKIDYIC